MQDVHVHPPQAFCHYPDQMRAFSDHFPGSIFQRGPISMKTLRIGHNGRPPSGLFGSLFPRGWDVGTPKVISHFMSSHSVPIWFSSTSPSSDMEEECRTLLTSVVYTDLEFPDASEPTSPLRWARWSNNSIKDERFFKKL